ncbi:MAG: bifunctional diaminohydroxyphosphoribosylaminopyrimidine deaminase/5-amino-6-(5-phosphoribosylamino)uracil reductase RibD [Verrucomicrobiota bacterium]
MSSSHFEGWMERAISLAKRAQGNTWPNPLVGSLVIDGETIIGEGFHSKAGQAHAEVAAIENALKRAKTLAGMTIVVTLEPCSTFGRTPPCCQRIITEKFSRIIIGCVDPNPKHAGKGFDILRDAGIEVIDDVLADECRSLNPSFHQKFSGPYCSSKAPRTVGSLKMVVSGGQTGVDRAALDWAMDVGLPIRGWCPKGRTAEDGSIPECYPLVETSEEDSSERTRLNVRDSDATLILATNSQLTGGTLLTQQQAEAQSKPNLIITLANPLEESVQKLDRFIEENNVGILNVAGPRLSEDAEAGAASFRLLDRFAQLRSSSLVS